MWYKKSEFPGATYFRKYGFSINEAGTPNIHINFRMPGFYLYLGGNCRIYWFKKQKENGARRLNDALQKVSKAIGDMAMF
jgi:hypothetical protein